MLLGFLCPRAVPPPFWINQLSLGRCWVLRESTLLTDSIPIPPSFRKLATWLSVISKPVLNGRQSERDKCWYVTFGIAQKRWAPDGRRWVGRNHTGASALFCWPLALKATAATLEVTPAFLWRWHQGAELPRQASNPDTCVKPGYHCYRGITNTCCS